VDWLPAHPDTIAFGVQDVANPLDLSSLQVTVNGRPLGQGPDVTFKSAPGARSVTVALRVGGLLRQQGLFRNELSLRLADISPQGNEVAAALRYYCLEGLKQAPAVLTDSAHPGYEDLSVLTDGAIMAPGVTTYGVTWASVEEPGDHWVVLAWPDEQVWNEIEVFWATYGGTYWGARKLLVQTWSSGQWVTRQTVSHVEGEPATKVSLGGVKSSRLRLVQPDGQGNSDRPDIMWITELRWR
jgi:hypothetical protein